jgi:hypothetical protein
VGKAVLLNLGIKKKYINFNNKQIEWLKQNYPKFGIKYCSKYLKCNTTYIKRLCRKFNIISDKKWREEEINFIKINYPIYGTRYCSNYLQRTCSSINHIAFRLKIRIKEKIQNKLNKKISKNLRSRIWKALKGINKSAHTLELLGCSIEFLKQHLEKQFKPGMTWENYGFYGWHIDHIIPCENFDLSISENQYKCFNYVNLQPLWQKDNFLKSDFLNNGSRARFNKEKII